jgi:hypothetical protein
VRCCIQFQFWSAVSASPFLDVNQFTADVYSRVLSGTNVDATLGQTSEWPYCVWAEGLTDFLFDECTLMEAKSCLHDQHLSKGTTIESIDVMFFYDPRPTKETVHHNLIGTDCGPSHADYASGHITFSDPHP